MHESLYMWILVSSIEWNIHMLHSSLYTKNMYLMHIGWLSHVSQVLNQNGFIPILRGFLPTTCHWLPTSPHPIFWPSIATEQRLATEEQTQITSSITWVLDSLRSSGHPKNKKTSSQNPHTSVLGMSLLKNKKPGDSGRLIIFLCFSNWSFYGSMVLLGCSAWLLVWSFQGYLQVVIEHFYKRKLSLVNTSKSVNVWWLSPEGEKHPWKTLLVVTIASWGRVVHPTLYSKYSKFLHYPTRWAPTIVHKWSYNPYTAIESYK